MKGAEYHGKQLPVLHTPRTKQNEPVPVQKLPKFLVHETPDEIDQVGNVLGTYASKPSGSREIANKRKLQNVRHVRVLKSATPFKITGDIRKTAKLVSSKENSVNYYKTSCYRDANCPHKHKIID